MSDHYRKMQGQYNEMHESDPYDQEPSEAEIEAYYEQCRVEHERAVAGECIDCGGEPMKGAALQLCKPCADARADHEDYVTENSPL